MLLLLLLYYNYDCFRTIIMTCDTVCTFRLNESQSESVGGTTSVGDGQESVYSGGTCEYCQVTLRLKYRWCRTTIRLFFCPPPFQPSQCWVQIVVILFYVGNKRCMVLYCVALHCIAIELHCIALHCIAIEFQLHCNCIARLETYLAQ